MTKAEINVYIEKKLKVSVEETWLMSIAQKALEAEGVELAELGLVIADAKTVQQLNRTYRGADEPTDVLAFDMPSGADQKHKPPFVYPPDGIRHLGEIIISHPQALQQAQQQGHSIDQELALLTVHGVLHLLGYDHEQPEQGQRMRAKEEEILSKLDSVESEE